MYGCTMLCKIMFRIGNDSRIGEYRNRPNLVYSFWCILVTDETGDEIISAKDLNNELSVFNGCDYNL